MVVDSNFWKGRKVLITGHTGFKGGWLSVWLDSLGAEVTGYSLAPYTQPCLYEVANIRNRVNDYISDVRELDSIRNAIKEHRPEIIFHMAAQPLVRHSYKDPVDTYSTNVIGTVNVLEVVRLEKCAKVIINITSDKCYENREWVWGYRENDRLGGHDPYSNSKACAELVTSAYRDSYFSSKDWHEHGVAISSVRAGNVIGGGDWSEDRLIPDIWRSIQSNQSLIIRNPGAIRPWQHVLEPLYGYILLAQRLWENGKDYSEAWNFGPADGNCKNVASVVGRFLDLWGADITWSTTDEPQPKEATYLKLDSSKAQDRLGWHRKWDIEETLVAVIEWYKAYADNKDMHRFMISQIEKYSNS